MKFAGWITACVAHYRCQRYVRRAVESLLNQTYPWIRIVVINDGDPATPWRELASITDPRLVRFNLKANRGTYFCLEVARRATPDPYFMMQDADDWAAPTRAADLLVSVLEDSADLAVSAQPLFCETSEGRPYEVGVRWARVSDSESAPPFTVHRHIDEQFKYRAPHHGLITSAALRRIGGYYGGFRVSWDTLLTNLILMTGSISWTPKPLYYRLVRLDSLTHSIETGTASGYASAVGQCLQSLYQHCYRAYRRYLLEEITRATLAKEITKICRRYVTQKDEQSLAFDARRLQRIMPDLRQ
jgi:glycosyltransferase involved in cell wall biosynthesis